MNTILNTEPPFLTTTEDPPQKVKLYVLKRNGLRQDVHFDKITTRIKTLAQDISPILSDVDAGFITQKVVSGLKTGISTMEIDELSAETCAYSSTDSPQYAHLASRISVSNLQKTAPGTFSESVRLCQAFINPKTKLHHPFYADEVYDVIMEDPKKYDALIVPERDFSFDYFGFKVLERSYLHRTNGKIMETPQYMYMRIALGIHMGDFEMVKSTYEHMSKGYYTHATPTMFNGGTRQPQLSSCFLLSMIDDSIEGIYDTLKRCAIISKYAGGIGLSINNIRASGQPIRGTNGTSNGIVPMLGVYNYSARYVDQGGGKRKGSFAIYLEPWHLDVLDFLELKKNNGKEENRARDLFYALWIPDIFMRRVAEDGNWMLTSPDVVPGLNDTNCEKFEELYTKYEKEDIPKKVIKARELWFKILDSQIETGGPYILFKDTCNRKSNQKALGNIRCSNLCCEIVQYTSPDEVAVCNLASVALVKFVKLVRKNANELWHNSPNKVDLEPFFDFQLLFKICYEVTINLNRVIDRTYNPIPEAKRSNMRHRAIGVGCQALADVFALLKLPWDSKVARQLNCEIFETMYYACLSASIDLAEKDGPYETYEGSPASKGWLQFDLALMELLEKRDRVKKEMEKALDSELYDEKIYNDLEREEKLYYEEIKAYKDKFSGRWDWEGLKGRMAKYGLRNSLLMAPMPTASTSQILGNNECIEPYTSNIYVRRVLAGEFAVINKWMVKDLKELGLWNEDMKNRILAANGSIQKIHEIPDGLKEIYKTVWELSMKTLIDMAADRGLFICQSQSFNVFMAKPNLQKLTSMHFYSWRKGLKTGSYYLRTKPAAEAIKFTVPKDIEMGIKGKGKGGARMILPIEESRDEDEDNDNNNNNNNDTRSGFQKQDEEALSCPIGCDSCGA